MQPEESSTQTLPDPVVILGRGHSGTRLLAQAFGQQGIYMGAHLTDAFDPGVWGKRARKIALDLHPAFERVEPDDEWHRLVKQFEQQHLETYNGGPWGWKSSVTIFAMPLLTQVYPGVKFIHLIRDGRDVMLSRLRLPKSRFAKKIMLGDAEASRWRGLPLNQDTFVTRRNELEMESWVRSVRQAQFYGRNMRAGHYLEVRYESLCREPIKTLDEVLEFVGCATKENAREFMAENARVDRIGKWRDQPPQAIAEAIAIGKPLLRELGYLG